MSIRIYDPEIQQGSNACKFSKGNCSHLCLPISSTERVCQCGTGYKVDPLDPTKCIGNVHTPQLNHIIFPIISSHYLFLFLRILTHLIFALSTVGIEAFLLYSINWEIKGLSLTLGDNTSQVLGPISRVSMAASVDFHAGKQTLVAYLKKMFIC